MTTAPTPAIRYWPEGFNARPWRFISHQPVWRAVCWAALLTVLFLPALVATLVLLPWLPLSARASDIVGRLGARWMRVPVQDRRVSRWFDWRQTMELLALLVIGFVAFVAIGMVGLVTGVLAVTPFAVAQQGVTGPILDLGFWQTDSFVVLTAICAVVTVLGVLILLYACWVITGCAVAATVASNTTTAQEVEELTRSRAVLTDAFTGERRRIERELHDGAQQYLTALQLNVATLELTAEKGGDVTPPLTDVKTNARQALDALRSTVRGIYPQVLADKGLVEAVRELVAHSGVDGNVMERLSPGADGQLSDTPALLLYHCASEGLTNAVKHGEASCVLVTISFNRDATVLTVDDDGAGLTSRGVDGTGIAGLTERAATLGGTVSLGDIPGDWSTRLEMRLP
ncbi:MAG: histidine kinase [Mycobacteriaceae bacterium]